MSEGYAYACQRAELLGLPVPSEEEWKESQKKEETNRDNDEDVEDSTMQNLQHDDETAQRVSGGLDELNSILSATQKRLNRFKVVCSSLGGILKIKVGSRGSTPDHKATEKAYISNEDGQEEDTVEILEEVEDTKNQEGATSEDSTSIKKTELHEKMGSHLGKLDSLISKAENAQYSMKHQNKQMRKFLK